MSEKYYVYESSFLYFCTCTLTGWVKLFQYPQYSSIIVQSLKFGIENKGLEIFAYCIMPSHVHIIARSNRNPLGAVIRDFKKYTARKIIETLLNDPESDDMLLTFSRAAYSIKRNQHYKVWKDGYHPIEIYNNQIFLQKINYIHNNPVEEGLIGDPLDYKLCSAPDYAGETGLIPIEKEIIF